MKPENYLVVKPLYWNNKKHTINPGTVIELIPDHFYDTFLLKISDNNFIMYRNDIKNKCKKIT